MPRLLAVVALSLAAGFIYLWGLGFSDVGHSAEGRLLWFAPAPLWGATVGIVIAARSGLERGFAYGVFAAAAALGGGILGLIVAVTVYGTGS